MRKASTLIGLTLVVLGSGARAEDRVPASPAPAAAVVDPAAPSTTDRPRLRVGLEFLPMALGKYTAPLGNDAVQGDALFAYGFGLTASYRLIAGLSLGIAPQIVYNVNYKGNNSSLGTTKAVNETDYLARVAYAFHPEKAVDLYIEALPGWSSLKQPGGPPAKGFMFACGAGADVDLMNHTFATLGVGYQWGFQSVTNEAGTKIDTRTRFVRVTIGAGARF
jgi:hypothetical protein